MCVFKVLQIILFTMKNLFKNFKSSESKVSSFQLLNSGEMLKIRGGEELRPKTRPRDIYETEIG